MWGCGGVSGEREGGGGLSIRFPGMRWFARSSLGNTIITQFRRVEFSVMFLDCLTS